MDNTYKKGLRFFQKPLLILITVVFLAAVLSVFAGGKGLSAESAGGSSYIVMEATSGRVMQGDNINLRLPMASTTKAMTALVVIENTPDLDKVVTVPKEAAGIEGSSIYLKAGEKISLRNLLYGLMLRSGNDAAVTLAITTSGSVKEFANLMNAKAAALGLKNTHFTNPHGLQDKDHYTSAYDLAVIASAGMNNAQFKKIVSTKFITVDGASEEDTKYFANKNRILYNYEGGNGVKTGYTTTAGRCLIAASERNGMQVVAVALNNYDYFAKCSALMDYAHANYRMEKLASKDTVYASVPVEKSKTKSADLGVLEDFYYPLKSDGSEKPEVKLTLPETLIAPVAAGSEQGAIEICLNNRLLFSGKLYNINNIERKKGFFALF